MAQQKSGSWPNCGFLPTHNLWAAALNDYSGDYEGWNYQHALIYNKAYVSDLGFQDKISWYQRRKYRIQNEEDPNDVFQ